MLENILEGKKALFETGMQSVLRGQENRYRRVTLKDGNVLQNVRSEVNGVCATVYKNGVRGFASMAEYSSSAAEKVLKAATENAFYLDKYTSNKKAALSEYRNAMILPNTCILDIDTTTTSAI